MAKTALDSATLLRLIVGQLEGGPLVEDLLQLVLDKLVDHLWLDAFGEEFVQLGPVHVLDLHAQLVTRQHRPLHCLAAVEMCRQDILYQGLTLQAQLKDLSVPA